MLKKIEYTKNNLLNKKIENIFMCPICYNDIKIHNNSSEPWKVTIVDTGLNTMTGGRIKRVQEHIGNEPFMLTYGDGVCDIDINALLDYHKESDGLLTLTAIRPGGRFGTLEIDGQNKIQNFNEKKKEDGGWINGGFMVVEPEVLEYISGDTTVFEREPLETLARENKLSAYKYKGFWQCMDTLRDKIYLEELLQKEVAPWKKWVD